MSEHHAFEAMGPLQLRIMHYIWKKGPSTVKEVHEFMNGLLMGRKLAYTTILTVMRNLAHRKFLNQLASGRAHQFTPLITEKTYRLEMIRQLRKSLFGDDVSAMISCIALDDEIDAQKREQLRTFSCEP